MKSHKLTELTPIEAFQMGNFSSDGWYNAYAALKLISVRKEERKAEEVFVILERLLLAAAKDPCWLEFLIAGVESIQDDRF